MATIFTSDTVKAEAGNLVVTIDDNGGVLTGSAGTFRISEFGKIKYEHEIPNNADNATSISTKQGGLTLKCDDYMLGASAGDSFYERLLEIENGEYVNVTVTVGSVTFLYILTSFGLIEIDEIKGIVSLDLEPRVDFVEKELVQTGEASGVYVSTANLITNQAITTYGFDDDVNPPVANSVALLYDLIDGWFDEAYGVGTNLIRNLTSGLPTPGNQTFIDSAISTNTVVAELSRFAAQGGYIFGSAMGVNYFIKRSDTNAADQVELGLDTNVVALTSNRRPKVDIKEVIIVGQPFYAIGTAFYPQNKNNVISNLQLSNYKTSRRRFLGTYLSYVGAGEYDGSNFVIISPQVSTLFDTHIADGATAYGLAFGYGGSPAEPKVRVKGEVSGILTLKPYNTIKFDATVADYIRLVGGVQALYRLTSIEYDVKKDTAKFEAYYIGDA